MGRRRRKSTLAIRPNRTPDELRLASKHLNYEVMMFEETSRALESRTLTDVHKYAFLESFTIHARALVFFFFAENGHPTDVLATDFFPDATNWRAAHKRSDIPVALAKVGGRVGKEIAHLTYDRLGIDYEASKWDVTAMRQAMMAVVKDFAGSVPRWA
jgi:hypothetical protein